MRSSAGVVMQDIGPELPVFSELKVAVADQFQAMSAHELFRTGIDKDALWACYLKSFPEGTNPVFRKRTEHDCSCCRQFIRTVGDVVAVIDGKLVSVWDIDVQNAAYRTVASAMSALVKSRPIDNRFLHRERTAGTDRNYENIEGTAKEWQHFFVQITHRNDRSFVCDGPQIGPKLANARAAHDVLLRSLVELKPDAIDAVMALIAQNALYRGAEHRFAVEMFRNTKIVFDRLRSEERDNFAWVQAMSLPGSVLKIRNTSIGQLLIDLSDGKDVEVAVSAFERMVAPANYKRPTSLVTPAMVDMAKATVLALGLESALERRYATITDITINNILYADRGARNAMAGDVFSQISGAAVVKTKAFNNVEQVGIDDFLTKILPGAEGVEVLVENRHTNNLVSLVAPVDTASAMMFKWDNRFSWSYNGDFADSIKERVKTAGGNVTGDLCCRLAWFNHDDLDFHMDEYGKFHIYFGNKSHVSPNGGMLDVDMNAGAGYTREPVENIVYADSGRMAEGTYLLYVNQYNRREARDVGFEVEIDWKGNVRHFDYANPMRTGENVNVAEIRYTKAGGCEIVPLLPESSSSKKVWGIDTQAFHRVGVVMLSPNHWDDRGVGNKHWFFIVDGCRNDGTARGFYNEFLRGELDQHRKVFEIVGSKMRTDEADSQLSGLGFSSTKRDNAIFRIKGKSQRVLRVNF